ncbi:hypothetical protein FLK61_40160 [Paenalkalicoccus suaedae]|uniref:Uncharacterized protein n=1 Tax=Paenalkalicoccus suaedae TaxID=2592382 RepID=A0A859FI50_9BACI|nr:hypothetical protein FLK61_40160 [Paenalkalicoccus suaedae]
MEHVFAMSVYTNNTTTFIINDSTKDDEVTTILHEFLLQHHLSHPATVLCYGHTYTDNLIFRVQDTVPSLHNALC